MGELIQRHVAQTGGSSDLIMTVLMVGSMFAVIYFLLIRPQKKQQQEQQQVLAALKKGDEVLLASGIYGKIHSLTDKTVMLEIADKTRIKILKSAIHGRTVIQEEAEKALPEGGEEAVVEKTEKKKKKSA